MRWTRPSGGVDAVIAGGGPAGAMLGLLLARAGREVVVLEKHRDFLRDFRGDTIHPSTLETLGQLGLAERFLALPHVEARTMEARIDGRTLSVPIERLRTPFPFVAFVPQWDFLDFVTKEAARYPGFRLILRAEVVDLLREDGVVRGVQYRSPDGDHELRALVTVGTDGRDSTTRAVAGLPMVETSPPMDVLWFRLSRGPQDDHQPSLRVGNGAIVARFDRGDYWQMAHVVAKGGHVDAAAVRRAVAELNPELADRVHEIDEPGLKRLTVRADRLKRWFMPGYLAIGDAAHAMSPVGGVGINVAIQDAVSAANALWRPLAKGELHLRDLRRVQRRRALPVRVVQAIQGLLQRGLVVPALRGDNAGNKPTMRLGRLARRPLASLVAKGLFRPRVHSPQTPCAAASGAPTAIASPRRTRDRPT